MERKGLAEKAVSETKFRPLSNTGMENSPVVFLQFATGIVSLDYYCPIKNERKYFF